MKTVKYILIGITLALLANGSFAQDDSWYDQFRDGATSVIERGSVGARNAWEVTASATEDAIASYKASATAARIRERTAKIEACAIDKLAGGVAIGAVTGATLSVAIMASTTVAATAAAAASVPVAVMAGSMLLTDTFYGAVVGGVTGYFGGHVFCNATIK